MKGKKEGPVIVAEQTSQKKKGIITRNPILVIDSGVKTKTSRMSDDVSVAHRKNPHPPGPSERVGKKEQGRVTLLQTEPGSVSRL